LTEDAGVNGAHELLADYVEAVADVDLHDVLLVLECALAKVFVVVVVVFQRLSQEVQTVQMMKTLDVCRIPAAILWVDLDLVRRYSSRKRF